MARLNLAARCLAACLAALAFAPLAFVPGARAEEPVVRVYSWVYQIGEATIAGFEEETGIKVVLDGYDPGKDLHAALLAGDSGYDVVLHAGSLVPALIEAGALRRLSTPELENWDNLDPRILEILAGWDPGNGYAVPYTWGTVGITYNLDMVGERIPDAPLDSLDMLFEPALASKLADCGISVLDQPVDVIPMVLAYLGRDPRSDSGKDHDSVAAAFEPVRPYIRAFDSTGHLDALPEGELCMALTWSGDYATVSWRAEQADSDVDLAYRIPQTGTGTWFDVWLVPADARHPESAEAWLSYMLRPEAAAAATAETYYANANAAANELVDPELLADRSIYPDESALDRLWAARPLLESGNAVRLRTWAEIKSAP